MQSIQEDVFTATYFEMHKMVQWKEKGRCMYGNLMNKGSKMLMAENSQALRGFIRKVFQLCLNFQNKMQLAGRGAGAVSNACAVFSSFVFTDMQCLVSPVHYSQNVLTESGHFSSPPPIHSATSYPHLSQDDPQLVSLPLLLPAQILPLQSSQREL